MVLACGTGTGNFPQPGDPDNNVILSARSAFGGITVSWTYPQLNPHAVAHTIVYRSTNSDPNTKVRRQIVAGEVYFDEIDSATSVEYFYWIEIVSVNGTVGDLIGPASAWSAPTTDQILAFLTGQIKSSELGVALTTELGKIITLETSLGTEEAARIAGDGALSTTLGLMQSSLDATDVLVADEIAARIAGDSALVTQVNAILAQANLNAAAIVTEQSVRADGDSANATAITTLQSTVDGNTSTIQTLQTVQDGIKAQYMVKLDVNGYVGGFGLYNDGGSAQFLVNADRFAVGNLGATAVLPFIIDGGVVYINAAVIKAATIDDVMIQDAAVKTAKIQDAAITNAKIGLLAVGSANIQDAAITNAKIGTAAVDDAKIANLAVTTGKIDIAAVGTLQIGDNAVTVPVASYTSGDFTATNTGTWYTVAQATINGEGQPIQAIFGFAYNLAAIADYDDLEILHLHVRVYRDTSSNLVYADTELSWVADDNQSGSATPSPDTVRTIKTIFSASLTDTPPSGNHTYYLQINVLSDNGPGILPLTGPSLIGTFTASRRTIVLLGVKR